MSVTLREVMAAARARAAGLAAEVAGYLVLGASDQVLGGARCLGPEDVALTDDGQVRVVAGRSGSDAEAEACLRRLLGQLLAHASSVTPALLRASSREAGAGVQSLVNELEAALIPVNRAAGRRACARLHRDTVRAIEAGVLDGFETPEPLGAAPSPEPVRAAPASEPAVETATVVGAVDEWSLPVPASPQPRAVAPVDASWMSPTVSEVTERESEIFEATANEASSPYMEVDWVEDEAEADLRPVPDLEVPPTPPPRRSAAEPDVDALTKPEPVIARREIDAARAHDALVRKGSETPRLGSFVEVDVASEAVLELGEADATERMPDVAEFVGEPPADLSPPAPFVGEISTEGLVQANELAAPDLPQRPSAERRYAPSRYASRKSDVDELLSRFGVQGASGDAELCRDLKNLAGVDATAIPPAVAVEDATPPPVAVEEDKVEPARAPNRESARWLVGSLGVLLMLGAAGSSSLPPRSTPELQAVAAAAATQLSDVVAQVAEPACSAEIRVKHVPPGDRVTLTAGPARRTLEAKVSGRLAAFERLPCREAVEVTVGSSRRGRWSTIPVTAARLTPSPGASRVRVTLLAR